MYKLTQGHVDKVITNYKKGGRTIDILGAQRLARVLIGKNVEHKTGSEAAAYYSVYLWNSGYIK